MEVHTVRDDRMGGYTYKRQCYHAFSSFAAVQTSEGRGASLCPWF